MSDVENTDGQYAQRGFHLEESITTTAGARTIFVEHMAPGTQVPPHYHTRFAETFDLISGHITVYASADHTFQNEDLPALEATAQQLEVGKKVTVEPGVHHRYVVGSENATLRVVLTPGDAGFERLLMVLNGLAADNELQKLSDSSALMAIALELADAHPVGPVAQMVSTVRSDRAEEIDELKMALLARYDNQDGLQKLMGGHGHA